MGLFSGSFWAPYGTAVSRMRREGQQVVEAGAPGVRPLQHPVLVVRDDLRAVVDQGVGDAGRQDAGAPTKRIVFVPLLHRVVGSHVDPFIPRVPARRPILPRPQGRTERFRPASYSMPVPPPNPDRLFERS